MSETIPRSLTDTAMKKMYSRKELAIWTYAPYQILSEKCKSEQEGPLHVLHCQNLKHGHHQVLVSTRNDGDSHFLLVAMHIDNHFGQQIHKNIALTCGADIVFFNTYLKELKTSLRMFIAALFITAKLWKPPRCPSDNREINTEYLDCETLFTIKKELDRYKAMK